jgi:hypothetical protein
MADDIEGEDTFIFLEAVAIVSVSPTGTKYSNCLNENRNGMEIHCIQLT